MKSPTGKAAHLCTLLAMALLGSGCQMVAAAGAASRGSGSSSWGGPPAGLPPRTVYPVEEPLAPPPPPPRGQVTFYTLPNFRGDSFTVEAGSSLDRLEEWDNDISSFRVEGAASVQIFAEPRFRGQGLETSSSLSDLIAEKRGGGIDNNWENVVSSLRVIPARNLNTRVYDSYGLPNYDRRSAENIVRRAYRDVLGRDADPSGLATYSQMLINGSLSEESLRQRLRQSGEFGRVDHTGFITRSYREILKREPDAAGLEHYRVLMADRGWTEAQVRADLLRSSERSSAAATAAVTKAYWEILRRDPDAGGLASYVGRMMNDGWTEERVRASLRSSEEFRRLTAPPPAQTKPAETNPPEQTSPPAREAPVPTLSPRIGPAPRIAP